MENYTKYKLKSSDELASVLDGKDNLFVIACNKCFKEFETVDEPDCDEFLKFAADQGKNVILIEMTDRLAADEMRTNREELLAQIAEKVTVLLNTTCTSIKKGSVVCKDRAGTVTSLPADTVLFAVGMRPNLDTALQFADSAPNVRFVGDCKKAGNIRNAVRQGYDAAASIE